MTRLRIGSLCSGYGGLDMAVEQFFDAETAWFSEFDAAPSKVLAHRWPGVPNLGDMTRIDWAAAPDVDIVAGGTPCQDLSHAGKRAGMTEGTRSNLWAQMRECVAVKRPRFVVWENVRGAYSAHASSDVEREAYYDATTSDVEHDPGLLGIAYGPGRPALRALGRVLGDLTDLGYDTRWTGLRAADAGAPHGRFRVFVLARAVADADGEGLAQRRGVRGDPGTERATAERGRHGAADADTRGETGVRRPGLRTSGQAGERGARLGDVRVAAADAASVGWGEGWAESARVQGGLDDELGGSGSAADTDDGAGNGERSRPRPAVGDAAAAADAGRDGLGRLEELDGDPARPELEAPHRVDADGRAAADSDVAELARERAERSRRASAAGSGGEPSCITCGCDEWYHDADGFCARCLGQCGPDAATDTGRVGLGEHTGESPAEETRSAGRDIADGPRGSRPDQDWGPYRPAVERWEGILSRHAPAPTNPDGRNGSHRLAPEFVEWMMGIPAGWVTDPTIGLTRNQQLKALGNGVVPQQALLALSRLAGEAAA